MDSKTARLLLKTGYSFNRKYDFDEIDKKRLDRYFSGMLSYESSVDLLKETARNYFLNNADKLSNFEEEILTAKVLQNKSWEDLEKEFNVPFKKLFEIIRGAIQRLHTR